MDTPTAFLSDFQIVLTHQERAAERESSSKPAGQPTMRDKRRERDKMGPKRNTRLESSLTGWQRRRRRPPTSAAQARQLHQEAGTQVEPNCRASLSGLSELNQRLLPRSQPQERPTLFASRRRGGRLASGRNKLQMVALTLLNFISIVASSSADLSHHQRESVARNQDHTFEVESGQLSDNVRQIGKSLLPVSH